MKFTKQIVVFLLILVNSYLIDCLDNEKFNFSNKNNTKTNVDKFFSRGFSYLKLDKEINQFPLSGIGEKNIFMYDTILRQNVFPHLLYSNELFRYNINRNTTRLNPEEMRKYNEITVTGANIPTVNSGSYKKAISHIFRRAISYQLTIDTYGIKYVSPNHDNNFPFLSDDILAEVYKKFYKYPNSVQNGATFSDFINDDNLIQGSIDFFNDYGTHYITDYTLGYRFGFNREYRSNKTFLENEQGKIPVAKLESLLSFTQKTEKSILEEKSKDKNTNQNNLRLNSRERFKNNNRNARYSKDTNGPSNNQAINKDNGKDKNSKLTSKDVKLNKNPEPIPFPTKKKNNPLIPNSPQDIDPNDPDKTIDDDSIIQSSFQDPSTNSILKNSLTSLGKAKFSNQTRYQFLADENPSVTYNSTPTFSHFAIGECEIDKFFIKTNKCNKEIPKLVKFKVAPIHNLFNPLFQTRRLFKFNNTEINPKKMLTIFHNIKRMFYLIQEALDPKLFVVTDIFSVQTERTSLNTNTDNECFKTNPNTLEIVNKKYAVVNTNSVFYHDSIQMNKHLPVISIVNYATPKKGFNIISSAEKSMFWCTKREHNIHPEDLITGEWRKRKYLLDIKFIIDNDNKPFTDAGFKCSETWEFHDQESKSLDRWHFCAKYTYDFTHPLIITDVKIFSFQKSMAKCFNNSLITWLNGRKYYCDCEINLQKMSDEAGQQDKDVFFCYSRKSEMLNKPITPNQPLNSKSRFAPKKDN